MEGFLLVDKAAGVTSHDVVAMARKRLDTKKIGHAGTLDPMATGVLVLGVGVATRLLTYITDGKKGYEATISLGKSTHTDDAEGQITSIAPAASLDVLTDDVIKAELNKFIGKIQQRPSSVSAIKIDGKTAHARVRAGENIEISTREIEIQEISVSQIRKTDGAIEVDISVSCSAGTYIRAIARDLGAHLNVGGHLIHLRRTLVSPFTLDQCEPVTSAKLLPISDVIGKLFKTRILDLVQVREITFGRSIEQNSHPGVIAALDNHDNFLALLENKLVGTQLVAAPILVKVPS